MKRIVCVTLTLLLAAFILAGCADAPDDKMYDKDDNNISDANNVVLSDDSIVTLSNDDNNITISVGGTYTLHLDANPTTGYDWAVSISDESIVRLENMEYEQQPGSEGLAGAGGTDILTFKGLKTGSATITLTYERSFEENSALKTLVYNVTVE